MTPAICTKCDNHYVRGGWYCWSGNKSLGFCRPNTNPHPKAKHYKIGFGKAVAFQNIRRTDNA